MEQSKKQIELVSDFDIKERPFIWFYFSGMSFVENVSPTQVQLYI